MPQNTQITVNDGKATPVQHVFAPTKIDANNKAFFVEQAGDTLQGRPTLSYQLAGGSNGAAYKAVIQLNLPKTATITDANGVVKVSTVHTCIAKVELVLPPSTTLAERKDLRVLLANLLTDDVLAPAIDNVESFW